MTTWNATVEVRTAPLADVLRDIAVALEGSNLPAERIPPLPEGFCSVETVQEGNAIVATVSPGLGLAVWLSDLSGAMRAWVAEVAEPFGHA